MEELVSLVSAPARHGRRREKEVEARKTAQHLQSSAGGGGYWSDDLWPYDTFPAVSRRWYTFAS